MLREAGRGTDRPGEGLRMSRASGSPLLGRSRSQVRISRLPVYEHVTSSGLDSPEAPCLEWTNQSNGFLR
jgi:hypothetical protein